MQMTDYLTSPRLRAWGLAGTLWAATSGLQAQVQPLPVEPLQPVRQAPVGQSSTPLGVQGGPLGSTPASTADAANATEPQPLSSLASVGNDYRINPNDLLEFDVYGVPGMKRDVRVNASGLVSLPLIGPVQVSGLTGQQAESLIAQRYAEKYLQNPQVSLFIKEFTTQRITIEGAVLKPGIYPVTGQLSLLRALALAGGYAQYAELKEIMLYRYGANGQREVQTFDLEKVRAGEIMDPEVLADDVVVVKRNSSRTALRDSIFRDIIDTINPFSNR